MYANTIKGCQVRQQIHVGFTAMVENLVANLHSVGYADTTVSSNACCSCTSESSSGVVV